MSALAILEAGAPGLAASAPDRLARLARTAAPILNRVVLGGTIALELLLDDPGVRIPRLNFAEDSVFQLLSTSMIDRLGQDLQKAGFSRVSRGDRSDRWQDGHAVTVDLVQVETDSSTPRQLSLEYATLLTHTLSPDSAPPVRCAAAPAVLAVECASVLPGVASPLESEELERVVHLIAGRRDTERECLAAPAELRAIITPCLAALAASDALHVLLRRALPDAAALPALVTRVRDRIAAMAC